MKHIELKSWQDYTPHEKTELLVHWWHYYGKMIITLPEDEAFTSLAQESPDLLWHMAVLNFQVGKSSQDFITAMRNDALEDYLQSIKRKMLIASAEELLAFSNSEFSLLKQTVMTYNDPEPAIPFDTQEFLSQCLNLLEQQSKNSKKHDLKKLPE